MPQNANDNKISGTRKRPRFRTLALFTIFLGLVTLLVGETALRIYVAMRGWTPNCFAPQLDLFIADKQNGATLRPKFELKSGAFQIRTNRFGLRGPEITLHKESGTTRVAVLGGSATFGYFASDNQEAARLLESALRKDQIAAEVINAGVPGYNSFQTNHRYHSIVSPLEPEIVILYLGWNDLTYLVSDSPRDPQFLKRSLAPAWERFLGHSTLYGFVAYRIFQRTPHFAPKAGMNKAPTDAGVAAFRENIKQLLNQIEASGAQAIVCAQLMAAHPEASAEVQRSLGNHASDIEKVIQLGGWLRQELKSIASQHEVPFIDASARIPLTSEYLADAIHMTLRGEQAVADVWHEAVLQQITNQQQGKSALPN